MDERRGGDGFFLTSSSLAASKVARSILLSPPMSVKDESGQPLPALLESSLLAGVHGVVLQQKMRT